MTSTHRLGNAATKAVALLLMLVMAGCATPTEPQPTQEVHPSGGPSSPIPLSEPTDNLVFTLQDFPPEADWVVLEVVPQADGVMRGELLADFKRHDRLDPCFANSLSFKGSVVFGPNYGAPVTASTVQRDPLVKVGYPFTEYGFTTDYDLKVTAGMRVPVLLSLKDASEWREFGATFEYELASTVPFQWRIHASGEAVCLTRFHHFPEGELIEAPYYTKASDLALDFEITQLAYSWIGATADLGFTMELIGPNQTRTPIQETSYRELPGGKWSVRIPELEGTNASVSVMVLDMPAWAVEDFGKEAKAESPAQARRR